MMLKDREPDESFPEEVCCIRRCEAAPELYIGIGSMKLPLCDKHWTQHCEEEDRERHTPDSN